MSNHDHSPQFSIITAVHDQGTEIADNLPALLTQQYEPGYEVIVVDESSSDNTTDVLKQLKAVYPHLYSTFLPKYHFQENRQRLALTLGVKAAKYDWVVFTDINTPPTSDLWLRELADNTGDSAELVLGYYNRKSGQTRLQIFYDVDDARGIVCKAERKQANGHSGRWLRYLRGKYDFIAVPTALGHDVLRLFGQKLRGRHLLGRRLKVLAYNLFH